MADLGLYFGDEDDDQLVQEDKALSYLVLANEQDDAFDPVDTEKLLAQMSAGSLISHGMELEEDTDVVQLLTEPNLSALEKTQLLAQSQYDFHRSFLARELPTLLMQMRPQQAISHVIPIIRDFSLDPMDPVRESLASQLDKIVLYFLRNSIIEHNIPKKQMALDDESEDYNDQDHINIDDKGRTRSLPDIHTEEAISTGLPPLLHDTFTPIFLNLLLDQNASIAHQARLAVDAVAQNVSDEVMESEILNGVIAGLQKLYMPPEMEQQQLDENEINSSGSGETVAVTVIEHGNDHFGSYNIDLDGEAELGKMLVVVLLTALAPLLGPERCTRIIVPKLEKFTTNSQFYVRKEIVMALGTLCKMVDQDVVVKRLLPLYDIFVQDDTWHIRRACCTILASFIGSLPLDMKASKVEEIYDIFSVDVSRSVRNSVMEVLGEVIAGFEKEKVPDSLLSYFLDMGQQPMNDHERAVMCAFSFPAVVLTAGRSKWELMKPVYIKLAGSFRAPIRRSLACSLHEIAKILGPELADRDLAPAFADCLMALEDEVKEGVLGHIVDFISCLSPSCRSDVLHDLLRAWTEQLERSSNWRLRDTLTGQIAALCEIADGTDLLQVLLPLAVKACTDSVSTIRESGVLAFPALWEASGRVGPIPVTKKKDIKREFSWSSSNLVFPPLHVGADEDEDDEDEDEDDDDEENEDEEDENENEKKPLFVSQSPDHDMEDVEMEDMTGDSTDSPKDSETEAEAEGTDDSEDLDDREGDKYSVSLKAKASEQQKQRQQQQQKRAQMQQKQQRQQQEMTTIKEQIIAQTKDFAIHGGFRSRVVAVQIIQSLLDYGVSIPEFEDYFLPILADRLADDSVANIRIWVARVVTWIVDSGYYGDAPISPSLRELHLKLQEDPDRDVRIYSGGPLILPEKKKPQKPKKAKRKAKNKNGDNEDNGKNKLSTATDLDTRGSRAVKTSASTLTVFHQNPKSGELMAIEDRDEAEIQLLFQNELNNEDAAELNDSDEEVEDSDDGDDDGDDDDNDNDEDEDDNDNDGDEKGGKEEEKASQGSINGPEASFRSSDDREVHIPSDLNSDDKCTVRPSDPAREEEKEERPVPVELRVEAKHTEQTGYAKPSTNSLDIVEQAAVAQDGNDSEDEKDEEEDEDADEDETTVVHSVVPYSTSSANGVSPLDVEMEEDLLEKEEPRDTDSGPSSSETEESSELESSQEPSIESCATVTIVDTTSCSNNSTTTTTTATAAIIATFLGLDEPTVATAFPPLSSSSKSYPIQWRSPPPALSYAALLKGTININNTKSDSNSNSNQQKSKGRTSSDITTLTSFRQANLSEPLHHTATATSASIAMTATTATTTTAPMTTTIVNTTPTTTTGDKKLNSLKKDNILIEASLSLSASRLSPSSSLSSSSSTSPSPSSSKPISSSPVTFPLRFSYAAVAARTFSPPPLTPVIGGTSTAMTF